MEQTTEKIEKKRKPVFRNDYCGYAIQVPDTKAEVNQDELDAQVPNKVYRTDA